MQGKPLFRFKLNYESLNYANKNGLPTVYEVYRPQGLIHKLKVAWINKDGIYQSAIYNSSVVNDNLESGYWEKV